MLDHAGQLHQAPQRDLAPLAAYLGPPQSAHQVAGFDLQSLLAGAHSLELRADAPIGSLSGALELVDLRLRTR